MKAILSITGFNQFPRMPSGIDDLFFNVLRILASERVTVYHPQRWDFNVSVVLEQMRRHHITRVMLVAYSWGAGSGAIRFAKRAKRYGIEIDVACFCDPVYRSRLFPSWFPINPLSLTRLPKIKVPSSIKLVYWVRQKVSRPAGHDLVAVSPFLTEIFPPQILTAPHAQIDEHPQWVDMVKDVATRFVNGDPPFEEGWDCECD